MNRREKRFREKEERKRQKRLLKIGKSSDLKTPALWSIPVPKHSLPSIDGKVRLYHYTQDDRIKGILDYGLIFGDVMGRNPYGLKNYNAPNLTSENEFHNPANRPTHTLKEYYRLEVYFDAKDEDIINYGWFDKTYFNSNNRNLIGLCNKEGKQNGDIDKQYLYKNFISPKMIKKISRWNTETKYWDRLSKTDIQEIKDRHHFTELTKQGQSTYERWDFGRLTGTVFNDWTGAVRDYYAQTDLNEVFLPIYKIADYLSQNLKGDALHRHHIKMLDFMISNISVDEDKPEEVQDTLNKMVSYLMDAYNRVVSKDKQIGQTWTEGLRERQEQFIKQKYAIAPDERKECA